MYKAKDTGFPFAKVFSLPLLCCILIHYSMWNPRSMLYWYFSFLSLSPDHTVPFWESVTATDARKPGVSSWRVPGARFWSKLVGFQSIVLSSAKLSLSFFMSFKGSTSLHSDAIQQTLSSVDCGQLPVLSARGKERWVRQNLCPWKGHKWVGERDSDTIKGNKNQAVKSTLKEVFKNRILWENGAEKNMFWMSRLWVGFQRSYLSLAVKDEC